MVGLRRPRKRVAAEAEERRSQPLVTPALRILQRQWLQPARSQARLPANVKLPQHTVISLVPAASTPSGTRRDLTAASVAKGGQGSSRSRSAPWCYRCRLLSLVIIRRMRTKTTRSKFKTTSWEPSRNEPDQRPPPIAVVTSLLKCTYRPSRDANERAVVNYTPKPWEKTSATRMLKFSDRRRTCRCVMK